jgi:hypothetical protein
MTLVHRRWRAPVTNTRTPNGTPAGVGGFTWHDPIVVCIACDGVKRMARDTEQGPICPACDPQWDHAHKPESPSSIERTPNTPLVVIARTKRAARAALRDQGIDTTTGHIAIATTARDLEAFTGRVDVILVPGYEAVPGLADATLTLNVGRLR